MKAAPRLPAKSLLAGAALGFLLCSFAGRLVSRRPLFEHFLRFHAGIDTQTGFYPTASELVSQVAGTVPRDKILVLVGGPSYLRGTGQNADELWTLELQRLLGSRYAVVNFAIEQAGITSFAGVAFQVLAREYPGIIYVSSGSPVSPDSIDGNGVYRYAFWDAYYKNMLAGPPAWRERVAVLARSERKDPEGLELHLGRWIDSFSYGCDLWNYVEYRYFSTTWSDLTASSPVRARRGYPDAFDPNLAREQRDFRNNPDYAARSEAANKGFTTIGFMPVKTGGWELIPGAWGPVEDLARDMFPEDLRSKCYILLVRSNPYFMRTCSPDDLKRLETIYRLGQRAYEDAGYRVVQFRASDFGPEDFLDGGHFMASGGRKLAKALAARIAEVAAGGP